MTDADVAVHEASRCLSTPGPVSEDMLSADLTEDESSSPADSDDVSLTVHSPPDTQLNLPATVTVLPGPSGDVKVYLVGTAHFSKESNEDVADTIRKTQPNVVVVELCESRVAILALDEETILEDSKHLNFEQIQQNIKKQGLVQGVMYTLLLSLSAQLTRELGMAPGGEFRRAVAEAKQIPGCVVQLGDRPVQLTLGRAISSLTTWQKVKMGFSIIFSRETVTKEEVEKCKQRDLLESMLRDITGEYPALSRVLVDERDVYLTYSLQLAAAAAAQPDVRPSHRRSAGNVVGVVGIGHVPGIVRNWGKVSDDDIPPLLLVPPQSMASFLLLKSLKYSAMSLLAYGAYRFLVPRSIKNICSDSAHFIVSSTTKLIRN